MPGCAAGPSITLAPLSVSLGRGGLEGLVWAQALLMAEPVPLSQARSTWCTHLSSYAGDSAGPARSCCLSRSGFSIAVLGLAS